MGLLRNIYYAQYYDSKKKGKEEKAFLTGNVLIATLFMFIGGILFFIEGIFFPDADFIGSLLFEVFPNASAKFNGQILGAILLGIIFLLVRFTIGTKKKYEKNIAYFNGLTSPKQRKLVRRGHALFISVCFLMVILMFTFVLTL